MGIFLHFPRRFGISLVETLVVIAIVGILAGITFLAVANSQQNAAKVSCRNQLRQIALATISFTDAKKVFPYSRTAGSSQIGSVGLILLLPYLEHNELYQQFLNADIPGRTNIVSPPLFRCPSDFGDINTTLLNYLPCGGRTSNARSETTKGFYKVEFPSQVRDGLSNTVFFSERLILGSVSASAFREATLRNPILVREFFQTEAEFDQTCSEGFHSNDVNSISPAAPIATLLGQFPFGTKFIPNGPSCELATMGLHPPDLSVDEVRSFSATSLHRSSVNAAFGDGAVTEIADIVSPSLWISLGTVAGAESPGDVR